MNEHSLLFVFLIVPILQKDEMKYQHNHNSISFINKDIEHILQIFISNYLLALPVSSFTSQFVDWEILFKESLLNSSALIFF